MSIVCWTNLRPWGVAPASQRKARVCLSLYPDREGRSRCRQGLLQRSPLVWSGLRPLLSQRRAARPWPPRGQIPPTSGQHAIRGKKTRHFAITGQAPRRAQVFALNHKRPLAGFGARCYVPRSTFFRVGRLLKADLGTLSFWPGDRSFWATVPARGRTGWQPSRVQQPVPARVAVTRSNSPRTRVLTCVQRFRLDLATVGTVCVFTSAGR